MTSLLHDESVGFVPQTHRAEVSKHQAATYCTRRYDLVFGRIISFVWNFLRPNDRHSKKTHQQIFHVCPSPQSAGGYLPCIAYIVLVSSPTLPPLAPHISHL